jgi:histidinol-phosphate/aromatic aminotransferase/cobyric acid decarboxylase-like protein/SAM-dependent methyltransferase
VKQDAGACVSGEERAAGRWYRNLFGEDFWAAVEHEHGDEIARGADELVRLLEAQASGHRVVEVASGTGSRAIALARAGYDVLALDPSSWAAGEAAQRAEAAGVSVRWAVVDPLSLTRWPAGAFDVALCIDCVGWGSDAEQRRLFRRLRRQLVPGGLLVVGRPVWIDADLRVYSAPELTASVRAAGFDVVQSDGERLVARALAMPPESLAVTAWRTQGPMGLDLRYAPDEAELLAPAPRDLWQSLVESSPAFGADIVGGYAVDDPYGAERGALVVGGYIGRAVGASQLAFAAGVSSLLHDLRGLADGGLILAPALVHGDLEAWAAADGCQVQLIKEPADVSAILTAIAATRPALVHLDRPTFTGDLLELKELATIAARAASVGAIVIVDESALPYLGGRASGATLALRTDNLVILRGFTKGYSLGGMRVGYAVASPGLAGRVRELVAPLQVGELALQAALRLLSAGDIFGKLRARATAVKPEVVGLLESAGLTVRPGRPEFPWVAVDDRDGAASRLLERRGIKALRPVQPPQASAGTGDVLRLTLPLSDDRLATFRRLLQDNGRDGKWRNA